VANHIETAEDLVEVLDRMGWPKTEIVAKTPHETYTFVVTGINSEHSDGSGRLVLRLRQTDDAPACTVENCAAPHPKDT
jgi:hypothetical protein